MQLSTKARYAARAMIALVLRAGQGPVKLRDIALEQDISLKYLEQVMTPLRVGGYVKTLRGSRGGYIMTRPPEDISLLEIIQCVEGSLVPVDCVAESGECSRRDYCATHQVWANLKEAVHRELKNISLSELAARQAVLTNGFGTGLDESPKP